MQTDSAREKAIEYLRFSDIIQSLGDSKRRQRATNLVYAQANNLEIVDSYEDLGVSAFKGRNATVGAFKALNEMASLGIFQAHGVKHILVEGFDRLSRMELDDAYQQFRALLRAGMTLHVVRTGMVYPPEAINDPQKVMGAIMFMSLAHAESVQKSFRVGERRKQNRIDAREGKRRMTRVAPFWFDWDDKYEWNSHKGWFKPIPKRADAVREIFELTASGHSLYSIQRILNKSKVQTFRTGNGKAKEGWATSTLSTILSNRAVLGEMQPCKLVNGKPVPDGDPIKQYYEPIISESLWAQAQAARRPNHVRKGPTGDTYTNLFRNRLFCGYCSTPGDRVAMHVRGNMRKGRNGKPDRHYQYLICVRKMSGNATHPVEKNFSYDQFERAVLTHIKDLDLSRVMKLQDGDEVQALRTKRDGLEFRLSELKEEYDRLDRRYQNETDDRRASRIMDMMDRSEAARLEVQEELKTIGESLVSHDFRAARRAKSNEQLEQLRAEMDALNVAIENAERTETSKEAMQAELYSIRERLSFALCSMTDSIMFDPESGEAVVSIGGGLRTLVFEGEKLTQSLDFVPAVAEGQMELEMAITESGAILDGKRADWGTMTPPTKERHEAAQKFLKRVAG